MVYAQGQRLPIEHSGANSLYPIRAVEPSKITEARVDFNQRMDTVVHKFINESVRATELGANAIKEGNYVTLENLKQTLNLH